MSTRLRDSSTYFWPGNTSDKHLEQNFNGFLLDLAVDAVEFMGLVLLSMVVVVFEMLEYMLWL